MEEEEEDVTASFGTISKNQLMPSLTLACIDDGVGDLQAGTEENIRDVVNVEEGESLIRNDNQEVPADVMFHTDTKNINSVLQRTTYSRNIRVRVKKRVIPFPVFASSQL